MIRRVQILNYRGLRYVDVPLGEFQLLVGLNGSGKSTLLDAVRFVSDLVRDGVEAAVRTRTQNFQDLVWGRSQQDLGFELALELDIPEALQAKLPARTQYKLFRYEVAVREGARGFGIHEERCTLLPAYEREVPPLRRFPAPVVAPASILQREETRGARRIAWKTPAGADRLRKEISASEAWDATLNFGPQRSNLWSLSGAKGFPVAMHMRELLANGVQALRPDIQKLRAPCPFNASENFQPDGANLPWLAKRLYEENDVRFKEWVGHVSDFSPGVTGVRVVEKPDDRSAYLMLRMKSGVEVPSWGASDGMLRALVLTLVTYLNLNPARSGKIYLLDEIDNGLNESEMCDLHHALSCLYDSQVLLATHSLNFVQYVRDIKKVLCFAIATDGTLDVLPAERHPHLQDWDGTALTMDSVFSDYYQGTT